MSAVPSELVKKRIRTGTERKWNGGGFEVERKEQMMVMGFLGYKCVPSLFSLRSHGLQPMKHSSSLGEAGLWC